jgi:hypothetical protein
MVDGKADTTPTVVLDDEGKALQLAAEKAKYRQAIAAANQAASASLLEFPTVQDAPTGTVTLGEKAGAFGPWIAHRTLESAATAVRDAVVGHLAGTPGRLLVVDDRALLAGAATAELVLDRLARLTARLNPLPALLDGTPAGPSGAAFGAAVGAIPAEGAEGGGEGIESGGEEAQAAPTAGSTLDAALNLLSLARTDYTLTAATVSTSPSELATLTAGALAGAAGGLSVEVDGFTAVAGSPSLAAADDLARARDAARSALARLEIRLSPVEAELTTLRARLRHLEDSLETWALTKDASPGGGDLLRVRIEQLSTNASEQAAVADPARSVADHAAALLIEAETVLAALLQPAGDADPPLLTAVRWERLTTGPRRVDHVLYVGTDQLAADTVTRRSVLGTSGRLTFLGAATVSWLLLDPCTGAVRAGGTQAPGKRLRFDLESGNSDIADLADAGVLDNDPLVRAEKVATAAVLLVAAFLGILAVVAALRLVLG